MPEWLPDNWAVILSIAALFATLFTTLTAMADSSQKQETTSHDAQKAVEEIRTSLTEATERFDRLMEGIRLVEVTEYDQDGPTSTMRPVDETCACDRCGTVYGRGDFCDPCATTASNRLTEEDQREYERMKQRAIMEITTGYSVPPTILGESLVVRPVFGPVRSTRSRPEPAQDQREPNERPPEMPKHYPPPPPPPYDPPKAVEAVTGIPSPPVDPDAPMRWAAFVQQTETEAEESS